MGGSLTCNSVNADAASTSCDKAPMLSNDTLLCLRDGAMVYIKRSCFTAIHLVLHHTNYERRKLIFEIYLW